MRNTNVMYVDDDPVPFGRHPDPLGWGVFISDRVHSHVGSKAKDAFKKLWLGCTH